MPVIRSGTDFGLAGFHPGDPHCISMIRRSFKI
jgi:hypothetical protein